LHGAPLAGWRARWVPGADLAAADPFKLLARDPSARNAMGLQSLLVVGAERSGRPGFILLSHRDDPRRLDLAAAESLLDHSCQVLSQQRS
jgi:CDP-diacylglycerol pyrophosphatase